MSNSISAGIDNTLLFSYSLVSLLTLKFQIFLLLVCLLFHNIIMTAEPTHTTTKEKMAPCMP